MDKIEDIRKRARGGEPIASIARAVGASEPTVRKYARMKGLSPEPPRRRGPESEVLAPYEETAGSWLDDDCGNRRKQRHTATRAYVRLRDEEGHAGSCSTARRHARRRREEMARERDRRDAEGFLMPRWLPGEVQVDFGEADFRVRGVVTRGKYLTVTFPHSNVGLTQVFWGETAECVCQGLRNVLGFVGGVPGRAVFDNAAEVGGRVGGEVRTSGLFRRFAAHYGLDHAFTNPCSGNEKGNVENKVGCRRRNLFVPVPSFHDARAFNRRLLEDRLDLSEGKRRYRLGTPGPGLFGEDREALSPLPPAAFSCARWETRRCNKQGTITVGGPHRYSAGPAYARREVAVALGAFDVAVCDCETGEVVAAYERECGEAPTDSSDPTPRLRLLCMRPAGWRDSSVRASLPAEPAAFLDSEAPADLAADLRVLRDESAERGWGAAVEGMSRSLAATRSAPSSPPRRRARWPRARRCPGRRSRTATGRSGRACSGRRGSPFPSRSRASTGPPSRSPTAGAATRCSRWRSCATRRTWSSTARRGAARPTWPPPSGSPRPRRATP